MTPHVEQRCTADIAAGDIVGLSNAGPLPAAHFVITTGSMVAPPPLPQFHDVGYANVHWYDAGWTEWAARPEPPIGSETRDLEDQK